MSALKGTDDCRLSVVGEELGAAARLRWSGAATRAMGARSLVFPCGRACHMAGRPNAPILPLDHRYIPDCAIRRGIRRDERHGSIDPGGCRMGTDHTCGRRGKDLVVWNRRSCRLRRRGDHLCRCRDAPPSPPPSAPGDLTIGARAAPHRVGGPARAAVGPGHRCDQACVSLRTSRRISSEGRTRRDTFWTAA
jgi:hypothetical protein